MSEKNDMQDTANTVEEEAGISKKDKTVLNHKENLMADLASAEHNVTPGAKLPGLPDSVSGVDAEKQRGRPRMSDEERQAARERKRAADRERHRAKSGKKPSASADPDQPDPRLAVAMANAAMISSALDLLASGISGGEYHATPEQRAATIGTWAALLHAEGVELPPWVQAGIVSIMHVAPAFATPTGKGRFSGMWAKVKGWWIARKG